MSNLLGGLQTGFMPRTGQRVDRERQNLLVRIYNLEYIAIPALQSELKQKTDSGRAQLSIDVTCIDAKQALQSTQDSLAELRKQLLALEQTPKWSLQNLARVATRR